MKSPKDNEDPKRERTLHCGLTVCSDQVASSKDEVDPKQKRP